MESEQRGRGRPSVPDAVVRRNIVEAAQRLLSSGGAAAMTMERVAAEAGIAKKTLYRFASDRAALIGLLVGSWIEPIFPGFEAGSWFGFFAPKGTPPEVIDKLNRAVNAALPALQDQMIREGADPIGGSAADFGAFTRRERDKWKDIVKASGAIAQ